MSPSNNIENPINFPTTTEPENAETNSGINRDWIDEHSSSFRETSQQERWMITVDALGDTIISEDFFQNTARPMIKEILNATYKAKEEQQGKYSLEAAKKDGAYGVFLSGDNFENFTGKTAEMFEGIIKDPKAAIVKFASQLLVDNVKNEMLNNYTGDSNFIDDFEQFGRDH